MQVIEKRRECVEEKQVAVPVNKELVQAFLTKLEQKGCGTAGTYFAAFECAEGCQVEAIEGTPVDECNSEELAEAAEECDCLSIYSYDNDADKPTIFCVDKERGLTALDAAAEDYAYLEQVMYEILINENTLILSLGNEEEMKKGEAEADKNTRFHNVKIFTTLHANLEDLN